MSWLGAMAARAGFVASMPLTVSEVKSMLRGPLKPPPFPLGGPADGCCWVCSGTVPETVVRFSVRPPAAADTPSSAEIFATSEAGKLSWVERNDVRVNFSPALRFPKPTRWSPFSFWSWARSLAESCAGPSFVLELDDAELMTIGLVTDMSVPTPVSGSSTWACARSRPAERALTVITTPTPRARPSAVRSVRPFRLRSSESM